MRCELTGKSFQTGNNVSHAKIEQKRFKLIFKAFLLLVKYWSKFSFKAVSTMELLKKGGLDEFLINTPNSKLPTRQRN